VVGAVWFAGIAAAPAAEAPKIVVQLGHQAPVRATLWTQGSRFLVSLAEDGSIVVWNVASAQVVDHAQIPWPAGGKLPAVRRFAADANGKTARITLAADGRCPAAARGPGGLCSFDLDLATREVSPVAEPAVAVEAPRSLFAPSDDGRLRPGPNHGSGEDGLFDLSDEHLQFTEADCTAVDLCRYGVNVRTVGVPSAVTKLTGGPRSYFHDADLTRDGRRLVRVESIRNKTDASVQVLDLEDGTRTPAFKPGAAYHRARWLDTESYLLSSLGYTATNDVAPPGFPPVLIVTPDCSVAGASRSCAPIPAHGLMQPIGVGGRFIGIGSLQGCFMYDTREAGPDGVMCFPDEGEPGRPRGARLELFTPAASPANHATWTPREVKALAGQSITAIAVAPDRPQVAVATESTAPTSRTRRVLLLEDAAGAAAQVLWRVTETAAPAHVKNAGAVARAADEPPIDYLVFSPDGSQLLFGYHGSLNILDRSGVAPARQLPFDARRIVTDGAHAFGVDNNTLLDLASGRPVAPPFAVGRLVRAGFVAGKPVLWAASDGGVVHFWNSTTGTTLLTLLSFPGDHFFATMPDGRYDTNLGPDTEDVRWLMPDAPWQSLAAQTFMRDYYEPGLLHRAFECTATGSCATAFRPVRSLATLNRILPGVEVSSVVAGATPGTVDVCVSAAESVDPDAPGGPARSGLHDLRLFRDGRLVAERGAPPADLDAADFAQWAKRTEVAAQSCPGSAASFTVMVPTGNGKPVLFTAYAFNSDRVKGETSKPVAYLPPVARAARTPRAYVVAIGINTYVNIPDKSLNFAVNDAAAVARALRSIPGHEVITVELTSQPGTNQATKAAIRAVFALLAGRDSGENARSLRAAGIAADRLERSTPDDVLIVSYSGHGYTDPRGKFYLLPSDTKQSPGGDAPERATMISSDELTEWLSGVDAAEMAMVIDACHSAASVTAGQFKPGPMGDPGLGQLAFDKGIRILAATQADDVALEDSRLRQGLLSFALTGPGEALSPRGRKAGVTSDEQVALSEWLRYAVKRVPKLSDDVRLGRITVGADGSRGFTFLDGMPAKPPRVQEPTLFDFRGEASKVLLQRATQ
jgi:hypothetical protein